MTNPWNKISLEDYENHMKLDSVLQLQTLNEMMKDQLCRWPADSVMILGIAGGNGLEHVNRNKFRAVYGVDINKNYLEACCVRYPDLQGIFTPVCCDLLDTCAAQTLPHSELLIANLFIEYVGYKAFQRAVRMVAPSYVSCIIQLNLDDSFVSDSPYLHAFDGLEEVHHQMEKDSLTEIMEAADYAAIYEEEKPLPNGKALLRLDFMQGEP